MTYKIGQVASLIDILNDEFKLKYVFKLKKLGNGHLSKLTYRFFKNEYDGTYYLKRSDGLVGFAYDYFKVKIVGYI